MQHITVFFSLLIAVPACLNTLFMNADNILLTANMSKFRNTENSDEYSLLFCRLRRKSPDFNKKNVQFNKLLS